MSQDFFLPSTLAKRLLSGRVVPFVGAGISRKAGLPDWPCLLHLLLDWAEQERIAVENIDLLRTHIDTGDFDPVAHVLGDQLGARLHDALRTILAPEGVTPTVVHHLLASADWFSVITTNFDRLLPDSLGLPTVLTWKDDEGIGDVLRTGTSHVMMMHGWVEYPEAIVLTPQQYRDSFRHPAQSNYLRILLAQYSLLFLGASLRDYDLKYFLEELRHAFGPVRTPHFALLPADQADAVTSKHLRENYGIEVIPYTPSTKEHPEVDQFLRAVIDELPQSQRKTLAVGAAFETLRQSRPTMTETEYLQHFRNTCTQLGNSGFARTAWRALQVELNRVAPNIELIHRIETTVALSEIMLLDEEYDRAYQSLRPCIPNVAGIADDTVRHHFAKVLFGAAIESYYLREADEAYELAKQVGLPDLDSLGAQLEWSGFLHKGPSSLPEIAP
jgi:hypothetical protein